MPSASGYQAPAEPCAAWGSRAASALHPALPAPEPCCCPGGGGWDSITVIISQLLETGFQQLSWALGSFPSQPWAARSSGPAGRVPSLPSALSPAAARTAWPGSLPALGFRGQQSSILMALLRNPRVTFRVPSHKLLRQKRAR